MFKVKSSGLAALTLLVVACAPAVQEEDSAFYQPETPDGAVVVVQNDNFTAMDIYAVDGSARWRLGSVPTGKKASLRIPPMLANRFDIQLQADPLGPDAPFTFQRVSVRPGAKLELKLAPSLSMSTVVW